MLNFLVATAMLTHVSPADQFAKYGREVISQIQREMYLSDSHLYSEKATERGPGQVSYNWGAGMLLSAFAAAAAYDDKYKPVLLSYVHAVHAYWNTTPPVPGFAASPTLSRTQDDHPDRYYDDNAWMVLALQESAEVLKDPLLAKQADEALKYCLSGEDDTLGGGIYWREQKKTSKNTCVSAPVIVSILYTKSPSKDSPILAHAVSLYDWTVKNLHDPATGLFWDNIDLSGKVQKAFYGYNTGLMIDANALLYRATGNFMYAERARLLERQSVEHWVRPNGTIADDAFFAEKLLESWLVRILVAPGETEAYGAALTAQKALQELHDHIRDSNGHYPSRWDRPQDKPLTEWSLLAQASAARAYFLMALYLKKKETPLAR